MEHKGEIKNPELIEAMNKVRKDNSEENMLEVLTHAVKARFILPVDGDVKEKMRFHAVSGDNGNIYQVIYADTLSFNLAFGDKKQNGIVAGFMDMVDLVLGENSKIDGFVINPGTQELVFKKEMLKAIAEQLKADNIEVKRAAEMEETKSQGSSIKVGDPQKMPDGLGNAVIDCCANREDIFRVFIQLMQREGKDMPEWLFIVDHNGRNDELFKVIGEAAGPFTDGLQMVFIDMGDPIADKVIEGKVPVFAK